MDGKIIDGLKELPVGHVTTIIGSHVALGNSYEVKDMSFHGKPLREGYDSHNVKVVPPHFKPLAMKHGNNTSGITYYDEYVVDDNSRILPFYIITLRRVSTAVIWRDPKISNQENTGILSLLKAETDFNIYGASSDSEVMELMKIKKSPKVDVLFITNGADGGNQIVDKVRKIEEDIPILVFCMNVQAHKQWAKNYSNVEVTSETKRMIDWTTSNVRKSAKKPQVVDFFKKMIQNLFDYITQGDLEHTKQILVENPQYKQKFLESEDPNGGYSALYRAAQYGHLNLMKFLIDYGFDMESTKGY